MESSIPRFTQLTGMSCSAVVRFSVLEAEDGCEWLGLKRIVVNS